MQKTITALLVIIALLLLILVVQLGRTLGAPHFKTPYQAVLLSNGQVFFGRLENASSDYPILRDVFYIQSQTNPESKQVTSTIVRRGRELHGPDRMIINRRSIMLIEPVKEDSQVGSFIAENAKQKK